MPLLQRNKKISQTLMKSLKTNNLPMHMSCWLVHCFIKGVGRLKYYFLNQLKPWFKFIKEGVFRLTLAVQWITPPKKKIFILCKFLPKKGRIMLEKAIKNNFYLLPNNQ